MADLFNKIKEICKILLIFCNIFLNYNKHYFLGILLSVIGTVIFALGGSIKIFGVLYSLGNITSIARLVSLGNITYISRLGNITSIARLVSLGNINFIAWLVLNAYFIIH